MLLHALSADHLANACRYNTENGGPALEKLTNAIHDGTTKIKQYFISDDDLLVDYSKTGTTQYLVQIHGSAKFRPFTVQVLIALCHTAVLVVTAVAYVHAVLHIGTNTCR